MTVKYMGVEVPLDSFPEPAAEGATYFAPVRIPPRAIDLASQVVPRDVWANEGIYTWLDKNANKVFKTLPVGERSVVRGRLKWIFAIEDDVPYLKGLQLQSLAS